MSNQQDQPGALALWEAGVRRCLAGWDAPFWRLAGVGSGGRSGTATTHIAVAALHPTIASGTSFLKEAGVPAVVAAIVAALITARSTTGRERKAARRHWLADALAAFYGPVGAKLELVHQTNELVRQERATREANQQAKGITPSAPGKLSWRRTYEQKLVQANIDAQNEIADIIETHVHYVTDTTLRAEAMQYLVDARMDQWRREAEDIDVSQTIIVFPDKPQARPSFHQNVFAASAAMGQEFRKLSDGAKQKRSFWRR
ncbi:MAG TPA: hypothetical protein VH061_16260 [Solirubrobacteraceae bacterium]|nr:hypothetical protein [Solirubrobacteraceae bacterium]